MPIKEKAVVRLVDTSDSIHWKT